MTTQRDWMHDALTRCNTTEIAILPIAWYVCFGCDTWYTAYDTASKLDAVCWKCGYRNVEHEHVVRR